jgi:hypothetical protein
MKNSVLFHLTVALALALGVGTFLAAAQTNPPRTTSFALPTPPNTEALKKHDLKWIKSGNDFDQSKFATAEAIDKEIENRIRTYDRETAIVTFDVPINYSRLSYSKYQSYVDFKPDIGNLDIARNAGALNKNAHFWRYGDIDIAVPGDTYKDQMNVYAIARAVELLKYRYPKAYQKLFVETRNFQTDTLNYAKWRNRYSVLLFSFDESPSDIAGGLTANGTEVNGTMKVVEGINEYSNISIVSIDHTNIQGGQNSGSRPVYNLSSDENYIRYLREGLVETLVHEMLHRYLDYMNSYKEIFNKLYNARYNANHPLDLRLAGEEAIATTTSLHYFLREGGLQSYLHFYYGIELNISINKLVWCSQSSINK